MITLIKDLDEVSKNQEIREESWNTLFYINFDTNSEKSISENKIGFFKKDYKYGFYLGEFKDGNINGLGKYIWNFGNFYLGKFKEGKRHGSGKYVWAKGDFYIGKWKDGKINGEGKYFWSYGDFYIGKGKDGKKTWKRKECLY